VTENDAILSLTVTAAELGRSADLSRRINKSSISAGDCLRCPGPLLPSLLLAALLPPALPLAATAVTAGTW
jgi:hypothetical protein